MSNMLSYNVRTKKMLGSQVFRGKLANINIILTQIETDGLNFVQQKMKFLKTCVFTRDIYKTK